MQTCRSDALSPPDLLSSGNRNRRKIRIRHADSVCMGDGDGPPTSDRSGERHGPRADSHYRTTDRRCDIDTPMSGVLPDRSKRSDNRPLERRYRQTRRRRYNDEGSKNRHHGATSRRAMSPPYDETVTRTRGSSSAAPSNLAMVRATRELDSHRGQRTRPQSEHRPERTASGGIQRPQRPWPPQSHQSSYIPRP